MRSARPFSIALLLLSALCAAAPALAADQVIHAGRLIDAVATTSRTQVSILIHDDRITDVVAGYTTPPGATVLDLSQATVLPGLIDCHVHVALRRGGLAAQLTQTFGDDLIKGTVNVRKLLLGGFTAVRNVGADGDLDLALKNGIERGDIPGPRMWIALEGIGP